MNPEHDDGMGDCVEWDISSDPIDLPARNNAEPDPQVPSGLPRISGVDGPFLGIPNLVELDDLRDQVLKTFDEAKKAFVAAKPAGRAAAHNKIDTIAASRLAWGIVNLDDAVDKVRGPLSVELEAALRARVRELLDKSGFENMSREAKGLLDALGCLSDDDIFEAARTAVLKGTQGLIESVATKGKKSKMETLDAEFQLLEPSVGESKYSPQADDYLHKDVAFISGVLMMWREVVEDEYSARDNTERDGEVAFMHPLFKVFKGVYDRHFGEGISRASRTRRKSAIDANGRTDGHHLDWIFSNRKVAKNEATKWGTEFGSSERAGHETDNTPKCVATKLKEAKTLRDQLSALIGSLAKAGNGSLHADTLEGIRFLPTIGFFTTADLIEPVIMLYIGNGYYLEFPLAAQTLPQTMSDAGKVVSIATLMLKMKVSQRRPNLGSVSGEVISGSNRRETSRPLGQI
ncbi:hypothetical protein DFS34DRAFT_174388 [Phlyctochytrium arcticum]|nr:hypothetical protein DFS34DRAFT_174388 [Phlyctochytrium arcticum]